MSLFKFNFFGKDDEESVKVLNTNEEIQWDVSSEITLTNQIKELDSIVKHAKMFISGDVEIGHVLNSETVSMIKNVDFKNVLQLAEKEHSDLIAGKYEGGLKIWECTSDLIDYFEENKEQISFKNKKILDLGCGVGILGIYAFMNEANVTFQDYNKEVIEYITIPNVLLNIESDEKDIKIKRCKFYSGDWSSFNKICHNNFDVIVTSETIYNECNYEKLLNIFIDKLTNDGCVYVAAKTHYFGVGGGTRQFEKIVSNNGSFNCEVSWKSTGGIQREILKISKKIKST